MPTSDIQAMTLLAGTHKHEPFFSGLLRLCDTVNLGRNQDGVITTAITPLCFSCFLKLVFFGSAQDSKPNSNTSLDRGDTIFVKILLSKRANHQDECRALTLFEETINLAEKNADTYFPADASFAYPYYDHYVQIDIPSFSFPDYGDYLVKVLLKRDGIDEDFFIQSVSPLKIQPNQSKSSP